MKKLMFIINPMSGKQIIKTALFDILNVFSARDYVTTTYMTSGVGDAVRVAKAAADSREYDLLVCCGGDGTLNEVINGVMESREKIVLGYIPAGSTNDFANSLKISFDPVAAAKNIVGFEKNMLIDVGRFNKERYFTYTASFGAFTSTSYSVPQDVKNALGHFAYLLEGIKDLAAIKPYKTKVFTEEKTFENNFIFGAVTNSMSLAGFIKFNRNIVDLNDGMFEILLVKQPENMAQLNKIVMGVLASDFTDEEVFTFFRTDKVSFDLPDGVNWTLDGEFAEGGKHIEIENIKSAIEFRHDPVD